MRERVGSALVVTDSLTRPPGYFEDRRVHIVIAEGKVITRRMIGLAIIRLGWIGGVICGGYVGLWRI